MSSWKTDRFSIFLSVPLPPPGELDAKLKAAGHKVFRQESDSTYGQLSVHARLPKEKKTKKITSITNVHMQGTEGDVLKSVVHGLKSVASDDMD